MRTRIGMIALVGALYAAPALATNGMRMTGFGPVQDAMGGVGAAAPLDASTIVANPAGLTALEARADLGASYFGANVDYQATGAASGRRLESDRNAMPVPTLGVVMPSRTNPRLALGLGGFAVAGMGVDYAQDLYGGKTVSSYTNIRLAPAAAYRLTDRLSIGLAANLSYAMMNYDVASGMMMPPRDTAGAFGIGATVGLQYRPTDQLTLGVAYETRTWFQAFEFDVPEHDQVVGMNPDGSPVMAHFAGGTEALDFDQPQLATIGAALRPIPGLLLAADVEWIRWSETNGKNLPAYDTDPSQTGGMQWNMQWDDQVVYKVGAEYAARRWLKLRAGYNYGKMPLSSGAAFENLAFPALAEHHVTGGVGLDLGHTVVNVAAMYSPESKLSGSNAGQMIGSYETSMSQFAFDVGVGYRF